jgi:hypothetical protein
MTIKRHSRMRRQPAEQGAALPLALAFLVLIAVIVGLVLSYLSTSLATTQVVATQRNSMYAANAALDGAIRWVQSDSTAKARGSLSDSTCPQTGAGNFFTSNQVDGTAVNVTCNSSTAGQSSTQSTIFPSFAILSLSPYHGLAPTSGCKNINDELGLAQVQNSKLLTVNGNVYINADADSDTWSGGCPNTTTAQHIQVAGNIKQRESCHDVDPINDSYQWLCGDGSATPQNNTHPDGPLGNAADPALNDPAIADPTGWAPAISDPPVGAATIQDATGADITTCPAADPGTGYRLVKFGVPAGSTAGAFTDATVLNNFMGGACPNAVFWFQPGAYYFNFTNASGGHEWTINDTTTRVVGGQPYSGTSVPPQINSATWKPAAATTSGSSSTNFTNPNNALLIDGVNVASTPITSGQTHTITLSGFGSTPTSLVPANAQINSVRMRVAHGEDNPAVVNNPTVTITPAGGGAACAPIPITSKHTAVTEDPAPSYDVTSCLNTPLKLNADTSSPVKPTFTYSVTGTGSTNVKLDGIWLDVTYTVPGRGVWSGGSPTASTPAVPGSCVHDGDPGFGSAGGVQFVFSGDSHINLKSGKVELCAAPSTTHQEIAIYDARGATAGTPQSATIKPNTGSGANWNNPNSGTTIENGATQATTTWTGASTTARTLSLSGYAPALNIPAGSTSVSVNVRVAHSETGTGSGGNTNAANRISQAITIRDATSGTAITNCAITAGSPAAFTDTTNSGTAQSFAVPAACLSNLTIAQLNSGIRADYTATYSCTTTCGSATYTETLNGIEFDIGWTPPASGGGVGTIPGSSGCITQVPYYNPTDHSPAYNGACALLRVSTDSAGGSYPRVLAVYGTVYAPSAAIDVPVDIMTVPVFNRGVVARMLMLGYNVANNALVPITTVPQSTTLQNRYMTLTASVPGKSTTVSATVEVCDWVASSCGGTAGGVKVWSWQVTR